MFLEIIITIIILALLAYLLSAVSLVLFYEAKLRRMFAIKQLIEAQIRALSCSAAVKNAKVFKLEQDYLVLSKRIEKKRYFVVSRMLNIRQKENFKKLDWQGNM